MSDTCHGAQQTATTDHYHSLPYGVNLQSMVVVGSGHAQVFGSQGTHKYVQVDRFSKLHEAVAYFHSKGKLCVNTRLSISRMYILMAALVCDDDGLRLPLVADLQGSRLWVWKSLRMPDPLQKNPLRVPQL